MLQATGNFLEAITANCRDVGLKIAYNYNGQACYIEGQEIKEVSYTSQGKKELGCIVLKVADINLNITDNTKKLKNGDFIDLFYQCGNGESQTDVFYVSSLKTKSNSIVIQAVDLLTYLVENSNNTKMSLMKNTDLITYVESIISSIRLKCDIDNNVVNPSLSLAYPKSTKIDDTFREIAIAMNACITFGRTSRNGAYLPFNLPKMLDERLIGMKAKKFCFSEPWATIDSWISYTISDDSTDKYSSTNVCTYFPTQGEQVSIGKMQAIVPANTFGYNTGTISFGQTCIPQIAKFTGKVDVSSYTLGSDSCSFSFNNTSVISQDVECEFLGLNISNATTVDSSTDNTNNIKVVNNMYIQSAAVYDTRIYENNNIDIHYFGNPCIEVGDTISIDGMIVLVVEHTLKYTGGLKGIIKGVVLNE
nr:hypothetical protein [uncultured Cellulosilyticum sp.]